MKHFNYFSTLLLILAATSCSYENGAVESLLGSSNNSQCVPITKAGDLSDYTVSQSDIDSYISFKQKISEKEIVVELVKPIEEDGQILAYAINYDGAWELISADKRTPLILASGKGAFREKTGNEAFDFWISHLCESVSSLRQLTALNKVHEENVNHWKMITEDQEYFEKLFGGTRSLNQFQYQVISIDTVYVEDATNHLVTTHWGQRAPFNSYCPLKSNSDTDRVPAGCVAIAGAQVLNFMHGEYYVPETAPTIATCSGHAPNNYTMSQSGFSSLAWDGIEVGDTTLMAALVAYVGKTAQTQYNDTESVATLVNLTDNVLVPSIWETVSLDLYSNDDYEDIVYDLLRSWLPSIVGASVVGANANHAFIIDRYMNAHIDYCYTIRVLENGQEVGMMDYVEQTDPIRYFGMNWGWFGLYDDVWCVSCGPWVCSNYEFSPLEVVTLDEL